LHDKFIALQGCKDSPSHTSQCPLLLLLLQARACCMSMNSSAPPPSEGLDG
jgi:hypothetical protein